MGELKQIVVLRGDIDIDPLNLSDKLSKVCSEFIFNDIRRYAIEKQNNYTCYLTFSKEIIEQWFEKGTNREYVIFDNKDHLIKMIDSIKSLGLMVNRDYFLIKNEFEEQEEGELICLAFKPENYKEISEIVSEIS